MYFVFLTVAALAQPATEPNPRVAAARERFQQAVYEFACHLALQDGRLVRGELRDVWSAASKVRDAACPADFRRTVNGLQHVSPKSDAAKNLVGKIDDQLKTMATTIDVKGAQGKMADLRAAQESGKSVDFHKAGLAVADEVVAAQLQVPFAQVMNTLREVERMLGHSPSAAQMTAALAKLKTLPNAEKGRLRAYRQGLEAAAEIISSAIDLYNERYDRDAAEQLRRLERPLHLAAVARGGDAAALRLRTALQRVRQAQLLVERGFENVYQNERQEGLRRFLEMNEEITRLLNASESLPTDQLFSK